MTAIPPNIKIKIAAPIINVAVLLYANSIMMVRDRSPDRIPNKISFSLLL